MIQEAVSGGKWERIFPAFPSENDAADTLRRAVKRSGVKPADALPGQDRLEPYAVLLQIPPVRPRADAVGGPRGAPGGTRVRGCRPRLEQRDRVRFLRQEDRLRNPPSDDLPGRQGRRRRRRSEPRFGPRPGRGRDAHVDVFSAPSRPAKIIRRRISVVGLLVEGIELDPVLKSWTGTAPRVPPGAPRGPPTRQHGRGRTVCRGTA